MSEAGILVLLSYLLFLIKLCPNWVVASLGPQQRPLVVWLSSFLPV